MGQEPNYWLRRARLRRGLSRLELADAINAAVYAATGRVTCVDTNHVGKWERGEIRWPWTHYRAALRAVLCVARDQDLGLARPARARAAASDEEFERWCAEHDDGGPDDGEPGSGVQAEGGGSGAGTPGVAEVRFVLASGVSGAVMLAEVAAVHVAVVSGSVRVVIEDAARTPGAAVADSADEAVSGDGARVYLFRGRSDAAPGVRQVGG